MKNKFLIFLFIFFSIFNKFIMECLSTTTIWCNGRIKKTGSRMESTTGTNKGSLSISVDKKIYKFFV